LFFIIVGLSMLLPMIHVLAMSLSNAGAVEANEVFFWPVGFTSSIYKLIFSDAGLWKSMAVSIYLAVVGTLVSLLFTSTIAYSLSRPDMPGRKAVLMGIILTFVFSVPLIPHFLTVYYLGLVDSLWAIMLPTAVGAFGVIIMKTFFQGISTEIFDAGYIDGCSEYGIYTRICVPLSAPVFATMGLFHAVSYWNSYFSALIFIRDKHLFPLQVILRSLIVSNDFGSQFDSMAAQTYTPEALKAGIIIFATLPIILVYPFLQKYFVKGMMLGSLKE
jgi:ABC-type glycerol-3-phosphate transport system permease component